MTIVANDTFTVANGTDITAHTSTSGHSWTMGVGSSGAATIQSNKVVDAGFNGPFAYSGFVPSSADYSVKLTVQTDGAGNYVGGPTMRMSTSQNTLYYVYWNGGAGEWRLGATVNGSDSTIGTYAGDTPTTARVVELKAVGSAITVTIDGVERISVTNSAISATGRPGAYFIGGNTARTHDDWEVDNLSSEPPVLSSATTDQITSVSARVNFDSDISGGTAYAVIGTSATPPSAAQIKAASGGGIVSGATAPLSTSNAITVSGLTPSTAYYAYAVAYNGTNSNVVATAGFSTDDPTPVVSSVSDMTPNQGAALTITGIDFGASQGTGGVTLGGVEQDITSWSDTSIEITVGRGTNKYGTAKNIVVTADTGNESAAYAVTSIQPQSGWAYADIGTPDGTAANRITAAGDLASGDQLAYHAQSGNVVVYADATFSVAEAVTSFDVEAWTTGDGWGAVATQTLSASAAAMASRRFFARKGR